MVHSNKLTLFALCVGTFVVMLDTTIMNIALPQIHTELSASFSELSWALNAYTILFAALTIPFSKLAHSTGKKRFYLGALFIFAVGSSKSRGRRHFPTQHGLGNLHPRSHPQGQSHADFGYDAGFRIRFRPCSGRHDSAKLGVAMDLPH